MWGPPLPALSEPFSSVTVLAPTIGSSGLTDAPSGGASIASGSYSAALFGLKGNADATSCVPAAFRRRGRRRRKYRAVPDRSRSLGYSVRCFWCSCSWRTSLIGMIWPCVCHFYPLIESAKSAPCTPMKSSWRFNVAVGHFCRRGHTGSARRSLRRMRYAHRGGDPLFGNTRRGCRRTERLHEVLKLEGARQLVLCEFPSGQPRHDGAQALLLSESSGYSTQCDLRTRRIWRAKDYGRPSRL